MWEDRQLNKITSLQVSVSKCKRILEEVMVKEKEQENKKDGYTEVWRALRITLYFCCIESIVFLLLLYTKWQIFAWQC